MKLILSIALLIAASTASGTVLDARTRAMTAIRAVQSSATMRAPDDADNGPDYYPLLVKLADASDLSALERAEAVVWGQRGDIVICCVPTDNIELVAGADGLVVASAATPLSASCDKALPAARADRLELPDGTLLDGSGVVAGLCDIGFDSSHPAFDGRIGLMTVINEAAAEIDSRTTPAAIAEQLTDTSEECHATHVAAIMAGAECGNGLGGVARGATIAATMSSLTDVGLLAGMEQIVAYAQAEGKPAVINASVGSYTGPHDGTTLFNQYLERLSDDAIVCMSAGNNGTYPGSISATIGSEGFIGTTLATWDSLHPQGLLDVWSDSDEPVEVSFGIYDTDSRQWVLVTPPCGSGTRDSWILTDTPADVADSGRTVATYADFSRLFSGYIAVDGEVDRLNGRYHLAVNFNYTTAETSASGGWARHRIAIRVHGRQGQRVEAFSEGVSTRLRGIPEAGYLDGNSSMSISDLVCGSGVISVGMTVSRNSYTLVDGMEMEYADYRPGNICSHSSYGESHSRGPLPDICAPGWYVLSAYSAPYRSEHPDAYPIVALSGDGRYAWTSMGGTSMSSPLVAGVIATWLQALPHLTVERALYALQRTARTDMADAGDPRYGASGSIDARAGLALLLAEEAGIDAVAADSGVSISHGLINCTDPSAIISLYATDGRSVASARGRLDASALAPGIYIVHAGKSFRQKIVVK